ncbi:MAG: signal peptidase I [Clostridia bacterium]|nr:signal peptidase I [Clostridia bacterium]
MKEKGFNKQKLLTIIGAVLCVILIPILVINVTLIVKSFVNQDEVPSVGGYLPLFVLTDSMYPEIESGDLIICQTIDPSEIKVGDVISFFDPEGNGTSVVTHKVIEVLNDNGTLSFRTQGTNNNTPDALPVPAENLVGIYRSRIPGAGSVAMFLQTVPGLIVCIVLPIGIFVAYEVIRRRKFDKEKQEDTKALLAELEALRAQQAHAQQAAANQAKAAETPVETPEETPAEAPEDNTPAE